MLHMNMYVVLWFISYMNMYNIDIGRSLRWYPYPQSFETVGLTALNASIDNKIFYVQRVLWIDPWMKT